MKLSELIAAVGVTLDGEDDPEISGVNTLDRAAPGDISYFSDERYRQDFERTRATAVFVKELQSGTSCRQVLCTEPYLAFARAMRVFYPPRKHLGGVSPKAHIEESAVISEGVTVYPFAYIGEGATIGKGTVIYPHCYIGPQVEIGQDCIVCSHVSIREGCKIGQRVILQDGCRIGTDGYGFTPDDNGDLLKIPQVGRVVIEDDVEIGANCCIDRATLTQTLVGAGSKFDNLVQIGHNVLIGKGCRIVAQVGIAGSCTVGDKVILAGQVGVADHLDIGDGATVAAKSGVTRDVAAGEVVAGYPAMPYKLWRRLQKLFVSKAFEDKQNDDSSNGDN